MHHPTTNAELARLAYTDALRTASRAPLRDVGVFDEEPSSAPAPIARLAAMLLPELPVGVGWAQARHPAPSR